MQQSLQASVLVAAVLITASCSDGDARLSPTQPGAIGSSAMVVTATAADRAEPDEPVCPPTTPSTLSLVVSVRVQGPDDVTIGRIRAQFTDASGRQSPQVTLPMLPTTLAAPGPTATFGVSNAEFVRAFPMTLELGCEIGTRGAVVVIVEGSDRRGRRLMEQATVAIR
jgi:hypothetical protein